MGADYVMSMEHIMVALSVCDRLPSQPQLEAPPPAPGIHLVLRGLTPGMYSGVNWIGLREKRAPEHVLHVYTRKDRHVHMCVPTTYRGKEGGTHGVRTR